MGEKWPPQKTTRHHEQSKIYGWVVYKAGFLENPPVPKERMRFLATLKFGSGEITSLAC